MFVFQRIKKKEGVNMTNSTDYSVTFPGEFVGTVRMQAHDYYNVELEVKVTVYN